MKILITSGGTRVPIDSVRSITNMSRGTYGSRLLTECYDELLFRKKPNQPDDELIFFYAKNSAIPDIKSFGGVNVSFIEFDTYQDYHDGAIKIVSEQKPDVIVSIAAVSDYTVIPVEGKISSKEDTTLKLIKTEKVLPKLKVLAPKLCSVIGFKLLVAPSYGMVHDAVKKVLDEGADFVVFNDLTELRKGNIERLLFDKDMGFKSIPDIYTMAKFVVDQAELLTW